MFFFTEPQHLSAQSGSNDSYGPAPGAQATQFNVSADFSLANDARAFACQAGMIVVCPYYDVAAGAIDNNLVNIVLKPNKGLDISYNSVKYYIYRGIKITSLIDGANVTPKANTNNEFIERLWKNHDKLLAKVPATPNPTPANFGYNTTLAGNLLIENIFNQANPDAKPMQVKEGEWMGTFDKNKKIAFEVITETNHLKLDLDYAKKSRHQIDVTTLYNQSQVSTLSPQDDFTLRNQREQIFAYTDPAALFGMHYFRGVKLRDYSGANPVNRKKKKSAIYTDLLDKFETKGRVYIDIRSEFGYSYNYYKNYNPGAGNNTVQLKVEPAANFTAQVYESSGWPILIEDSANGTTANNNVELQLRVDDNLDPILFIENKKLLGKSKKSHFLDKSKLRNGAATDWTNAIKLSFPNHDTGANKVNIAHHIKLSYFREKESTSALTSIMKGTDDLDTVFGGIDLPFDTGVSSVFLKSLSSKYNLMRGTGFTHVSYKGSYEDNNDIIFISEKKFAQKESKQFYPKFKEKEEQTSITQSPVFPKSIRFQKIRISEEVSPGNYQDRYILDITAFKRKKSTARKEDIFMLGLTRVEYNQLITDADNAGLSRNHLRRFVFVAGSNNTDQFNRPYSKYQIHIQGFNSNGVSTTIAPSTAVYLYSLNGYVWGTKDFGLNNNAALGLPDPGTIKPWKHVGKWHFTESDAGTLLGGGSDGRISGIMDKIKRGAVLLARNWTVGLKGHVYYPADQNGVTDPSNISSERGNYPLVVVVHGNGHKYTQYDWLLKYFAHNGFIAASIDLRYLNLVRIRTTVPAITGIAGVPGHSHFFAYRSKNYIYNDTTHDIHEIIKNPPPPPGGSYTFKQMKWKHNKDFVIKTIGANDYLVFTKPAPFGMGALGRSNVLFHYLKVLKAKFGLKVQDKIGLMGHSRGGEAVVRAVKDIGASVAPANLNNIVAVASLAPTDRYDVETLEQAVPFFVLYGSMDGDVSGASAVGGEMRNTGFSLYDRAYNGMAAGTATEDKSMTFVYGATHNGFITKNSDFNTYAKYYGGKLKKLKKNAAANAADLGKLNTGIRDIKKVTKKINKTLTSAGHQKAICRAYMNAFFRMHINGEDFWREFMTGEQTPKSVKFEKIYSQFKAKEARRTIDNFQSNPAEGTSSSGGTVVHPNMADLNEGDFGIPGGINTSSPHSSMGVQVKWKQNDVLRFQVKAALKDVSGFGYLDIRIAKTVTPPPNGDLSELKIGLKDHVDTKSLIVKDRFIIPDPHVRKDKRITIPPLSFTAGKNYWMDRASNTKVALMTIRIPLNEFALLGADLTKISEISLDFHRTKAITGTVDIDDVEFTN
ncbi:MAG: hypothetical protein MI810_10290 [Flavobacteriales bacterium]|nr:hypothetical protein [Flavobacteriales bacterium]